MMAATTPTFSTSTPAASGERSTTARQSRCSPRSAGWASSSRLRRARAHRVAPWPRRAGHASEPRRMVILSPSTSLRVNSAKERVSASLRSARHRPASLRVRLTLWYGLLLGVPLVVFAIVCYLVFSRALLARTDRFVDDALGAFARELVAERRAASSIEESIRTTISDVRFPDL